MAVLRLVSRLLLTYQLKVSLLVINKTSIPVGDVKDLAGVSGSLTDSTSTSLSSLLESLVLNSSRRGRFEAQRGGSDPTGDEEITEAADGEGADARETLFRRGPSELQTSQSHSIVLQSNLPQPMWIPLEPQDEHKRSSHLLH